MDKQELVARQQKIIDLMKQFCAKELDEECAELCKRLAEKLGRKKTPTFATGQVEIWAAGIVHALATINFLFDKSETPHTTIDGINNFFGTKKASVGTKSKYIRDLLKLTRWDKEFSTKSTYDSNPYKNLVSINGFIVPIDVFFKK